MVTPQEYDEATARGLESLRTEPRALSARYDQALNLVFVELNTGYTVAFPPQRSQTLHDAKPEDLVDIEIDYPGFSIYFPRLDDGPLVTSLARGRFGNDRWEAAWLAAHPLENRPFPAASQASVSSQDILHQATEAA